MSTAKSCINDRPISERGNDRLQTKTYVDGLFKFILSANTPVTIGVQGGWGSGKTSLIQMLQEQLQQEDQEDKTICVFVNAWEHSLLQNSASKVEVTLSLLQGLLDEIHAAIKESKLIDEALKRDVLGGPFAQALEAGKALMPLMVKLASSAVGLSVNTESLTTAKEAPKSAQVVRQLRKNLQDAVSKITGNGKSAGLPASNRPQRFVCFIDDLDRVQPETAIEILDVTKNIFDIEGCIFVLAIDYEVIVKGLEGKFGKKTPQNEREFRQYFDKIIQIPFTMPVGAYKDQLDSLLSQCFGELGYAFENDSGEIRENLRTASMAATDGIPRSVKRIVNTLSLLQCVSGGKSAQGKPDFNNVEVRFIVAGLHINFPEISRRLMEQSSFTDWSLKREGPRWNLPEIDTAKLKIYGEIFDEDWEQVVFGLCQESDWLKGKTRAVSDLLNALRTALMRGRVQTEKGKLDEEAITMLDDVLSDIRVVSVDDTPPPAVNNSKVASDQVTQFCRNWYDAFQKRLPELPVRDPATYAKREGSGRSYYVECAGEDIVGIEFYHWAKSDKRLTFSVYFQKPPRGKTNELRKNLEKTSFTNVEWNAQEDEALLVLSKSWTQNDFLSHPRALAEQCVEFYKTMEKHRQKCLRSI